MIIDLQSLLAEADGIARGLRPGFIDADAPASSPSAVRTAEEERRLMEEVREATRKLDEAVERTRAADEPAKVARKRGVG